MAGFKGYGRMLFWGGMVVAVWAGQQSGMLSGSSNAAPAPAQNVAFVATFDARMSTARVKAQHSLPGFLTRMASGDTRGWEGPAVKVAIPGTHQVENIWVADILPEGEGAYTGRLSNDPVNLDGLKRGDRVAFGADQMVDWTVTLDGRAYGHFGARAMLPVMDEDQAAQISAVLSTDPLPAGW
ncbi:DUF2314 domain-containing protein [Thalassococcus profundi]|uniref:DUF2314 domain-containing protein n=1 Tax=Thalassococcus profundi TaxID=2282382 RepID=A0A369TW19_9RHOB|nr:DUF2314 domain-containing protein [Thalassococcus profundi]RDD67156.1 DUF2314 domain-containing protein [Thalassococcus profundi]